MKRPGLATIVVVLVLAGCSKPENAPAATAPATPPAAVTDLRAGGETPDDPLAFDIPRGLNLRNARAILDSGPVRFRGIDGSIQLRGPRQHPYLQGRDAEIRFVNLVRTYSYAMMRRGTPTSAREWPWNVAFLDSRLLPFCSGALIAPQWVLTAAHCRPGDLDSLVVGADHLGLNGETVQPVYTCVHPGFEGTADNDIALVRLGSASAAQSLDATVSDLRFELPPTRPTLVGWGETENGPSFELQELQVAIRDDAGCRNPTNYGLTANMLCAGEADAGTCAGDSGDPLMIEEGGGWSGIGVASMGNACVADVDTVYTRLSRFTDWIEETMTTDKPKCKQGN